jgi:hypothetical protein
MSYRPALPVSGPSGKRARRREAVRLARRRPRGGKTQRQGAAGCYVASASARVLCPKRVGVLRKGVCSLKQI